MESKYKPRIREVFVSSFRSRQVSRRIGNMSKSNVEDMGAGGGRAGEGRMRLEDMMVD